MKNKQLALIVKKTGIVLMALSLLAGCGKSESGKEKKNSTSMSDPSEVDKNEDVFTNDFIMDKQVRTGFMKKGEQSASPESSYTEIHTAKEFKNAINANKGKYILMADLDMSNTHWSSKEFGGVLEGNYHVISGMNDTLFSKMTGTVRNLGLENVNAENASFAINMNGGELYNCYATGKIEGGAGLVHSIDLTYTNDNKTSVCISYCYNVAEVMCVGDNAYRVEGIGGIVGYMNLSAISNSFSVDISYCENYGMIKSKNPTGGIVGKISRGSMSSGYYSEVNLSCRMANCFNYGKVEGYEAAGGIVGKLNNINASNRMKNNYYIESCANYGDLESKASRLGNDCGGICGVVDLEAPKGNSMIEVGVSDCLNTAELHVSSGHAGEILGATEMNGGICRILRCLGIGNVKSERGRNVQVNASSPIYECTEFYSLSQKTIAEMKNIKENLPMFDYPYVWGVDEYFCGFPHPYGEDERETVQKYAAEIEEKEAKAYLKDAKVDEIVLSQHYADALEMMGMGGFWPEDIEHKNYSDYLTIWSENPQTYFDILDIDKDGMNELIVKSQEYYYAIYSYDISNKKMLKKYSCEGSEKWEEKYGKAIGIQWTLLKAESISVYKNAYMAYFKGMLKKDFPKDVAVLFFDKNFNIADMLETLDADYGVTFEDVGEEYPMEGKYNGKTAFDYYGEESGSLLYKDKVPDITIFGLYPGMPEDKAKELLEKYGFYMGDYSYKMGSCFLNLNVEKGVVQSIGISSGNEYAG